MSSLIGYNHELVISVIAARHAVPEENYLNVCTSLFSMAAFAQRGGFLQKQYAHLTDTTFKNIYQINGFDLALLIPYFIVLILLATYGVHRYVLVYLYYKHRKNKVTEPPALLSNCRASPCSCPSSTSSSWSTGWWNAICRLDYPREKLDIQVLDDSTDETVEVARGRWSSAIAALGTRHHLPSPHQPRRLQGGRAAGRA